ncbi:3-oxo-tetronate 4-phosphate decarboxylase [Mycobacterium sp. 236(2023)]|uniref:3-oxo-tetronate 4-phosphate decarboxylase n=1 Tax=Mycobacterium sp. 236(2023) TaxID=3038163 RepID=UPI002414D4EE|nr:3-oxo-tetronate 4-phosphate decarboxylase [Mycobacterium sp. 236(2023)]MDG4662982.1 aldolase [Mycobacterium sp. 236(2023)]
MSVCDDIVELGASFFRRGLTFGRTGNLSAVDADGTVLMTPTGVSLDKLNRNQLSRLSIDGTRLDGPKPTKEAFLHLAVYRARPTDRAVVHTHSTYSVAVSCLRDVDRTNALPALTAYYAMRVGSLPVLPYHAPGDESLGAEAEFAAVSHHALLLANHGPIVAGRDLASAADVLEEIEETAKLSLLLRGQAVAPVADHEVQRLEELYR